MQLSYFQTQEVICPDTQKPFDFDIWLIVDPFERPDLIIKIIDGTIHKIRSPYTGQVFGEFKVPLLIFQPQNEPFLTYSPIPGNSHEEDIKLLHDLLDILQKKLINKWNDRWTEGGIGFIDRASLSNSFNRESVSRYIEEQGQQLINQLNKDFYEGRYEECVTQCKEAITSNAFEKHSPKWIYLNIIYADSLVKLNTHENNFSEDAIKYYQKSLEALTYEDHPTTWADTHRKLAELFDERIAGSQTDNIEQSIFHYNEALKVFTQEKHPKLWLEVQHNLIVVSNRRMLGDPAKNIEQAIQNIQNILQVYSKNDTPYEWACMNADLGIQYAKRINGDKNENLETSIVYLNRALEVFHSSTYFEKWFLTLRWKGQLYAEAESQEQISNINYAINLYNDALPQIDLVQHPIEWGYIHQDLGDLYFILGNELSFNPKENISAAIEHYCQALKSAPNQDNLYQINLNEHLAIAYTKISAYELEPNALNAIHHYQVLEEYYQRTNLIKWTHVSLNIGKRYAELFKETKKTEYRDLALQYYSNTCLNLSFSDSPLIYLAILSEIGDTHFLDENWEVAIQSYKRLAEKFFDYEAAPLDDQEDIRIYQSLIESLYRLAFCYVKNNDFAESLRIIESIKLKLLDQGGESLPLSLENFLSCRRDTQLQENTVFFIPLVTEHGSAIFIIPRCPDSMEKLRVLYISNLTIKTLMELISNESRTGWIDSFIEFKFSFGKKRNNSTYLFSRMNEISEKFWENIFSEAFPILKKLNTEHLVIIPIGISRLIPYHVVWYQESTEKIYLADHFLISYAHGITTYNNLVDNYSADAVKTALIVGVGEYSALSNLPNAITEAKQVAQLFGCIPKTGPGASVEIIKNDLKNYAYLHFACHATYGWSSRKSETIGPSLEYPGLTDHITKTIYSSNYSDAAIILTNDKPLFLKEITNEIKLQNTRLVTLSACDTGQVDISNSPDLVADFPLAFLKAGAKGIISSLWEVDDSSVILLMYQFYKQHLHEGLDPIHALQKAQHWLRNASRKEIGELYLSLFDFHNQFAFDTFTRITIEGAPNDKPFTHPFYWAGFFYTGI